jgi:iron complex transport system substrate-binding protein
MVSPGLGYVARVRIVSLLPSTTEILFAIGAGPEVVGVTFECDYPDEARSRRVVSTSAMPSGLSVAEIDALVRERLARGDDLYHLDAGALAELDPDLVVTQDLCAVCAVDVSSVDAAMAYLNGRGAVLTIDPSTMDDVLDSITLLGTATGHEPNAAALVGSLRARLDAVARNVAGRAQPRVLVLEWTDPPFTAGHWVPDLVTAAGGTPVLGCRGAPSVQVSRAELEEASCEYVIVAPCGYHLEAACTLAEAVLSSGVLAPGAEVWAVDADSSFVRPGPRLVDGVEALAGIWHGDVAASRADVARYVGRTSANTNPSRSTTSPTVTSSG